MKEILLLILAGVLVDNYALMHFLGTGAVIENRRPAVNSLVLGAFTTVVMLISNAIAWPVNTYLLAKLPYVQTMVFVIIIMSVTWFVHLFADGKLHGYLKCHFTTFAINGAVFGLCVHNTHLSFGESMWTAFGVGVGFALTLTLFSALHARLDEDAVPHSFRGLPISLLTAGMIALAILGF